MSDLAIHDLCSTIEIVAFWAFCAFWVYVVYKED